MNIRAYMPYYRRNLRVAVPVMVSQAGQVLVQQIDNMMVGRVGTTELAAASFANSVFIVGMVFGMGFTFGLTPLVGHAYAKGKFRKAGSLFKNSLFLLYDFNFSLCL
jgi:MATE family multidrug resistance protein